MVHDNVIMFRAFSLTFVCIGGLPGPVLFGVALDQSCLLWEKKCDGSTGSCLYYDNYEMAWLLFAVCASCKVLNIVCGLIAWRMYAYKRRTGTLPRRPEHTLTVGETGSGATGNSGRPTSGDTGVEQQGDQVSGISNPALDVETSDL